MRTKRKAAVAGKLAEAERGFDRWRRTRKRRERIPERLWRMAVEAAVIHGVHPSAVRLRLDPARLKQRMKAVADRSPSQAEPQFVELPLSVAECTLEAEDGTGRKLRIHLKGGATSQATSLGRMLWRGEE